MKSGDQTAYGKITEKYEPLVKSMTEKYRCIIEKSGYHADEDDIRQEAEIALYKAAMTYESNGGEITFGLYAKICIRNRLISMLRKAEKRSEKSKETRETEIYNEKASAELGPEELLIAKENYIELLGEISKRLTKYEKEVFALYVEGKTYKEISEKLNRTEKSVDNAIYRIKTKLKRGKL